MRKSILLTVMISLLFITQVFAVQRHVPGDVIVKFRNELRGNINFEQIDNQLSCEYPLINEILKNNNFKTASQLIPDYDYNRNIDYGLDMIYVLHSENDADAVSSVVMFEKSSYVEYAELNLIVEIARIEAQNEWEPLLTPNDPSYSLQTFLPLIQAPAAWDIQTGNHTKIVAIVDQGTEIAHADIAGNYITGYDYIDNDNDPTPASTAEDHGTHCSGCAAAVTNNSTGIASIGYGIGLIACRGGTASSLNLSALVSGINFSAQNGADAISMSWGGSGQFPSVESAINDAYNNYDVVCLAAAGNWASSSPFYPAYYTNCVAVAGTNSSNLRYSSTNYGTWIDISAPAVNLYSTVPFGNYNYMTGTSMACPLTAGLVTLMRCQFPTETNAQIIQRLYDAADPLPSEPYYNAGQMGAGRINAYNSLLGGTVDTTVTVTAPNGGETWYVGTSHNITYSDQNVSSFDIHYSTNNGSNWISVASSVSANTYSWTIPNTLSSQCLVRVRDHNHTSINDVSDATFTIATGSGGGDTLYAQIPDSVSGPGYACQLDSVYPFEADIADDIDPPYEWRVDSIISWWSNWNGFTSPTHVPNVHILIWADAGNIPATSPTQEIVVEASNCTWVGSNPYSLHIDLPSQLIIPAGAWWIEIQPSNVFTINGQTGWIHGVGIGNGQEVYFWCPVLGYNSWTTATTVGWDPGSEPGYVLFGEEINAVEEEIYSNSTFNVRALNNFSESPQIFVSTPVMTNVEVQVFDMTGREVANLYNGVIEGQRSFNFNSSVSGTYIYRVTTPDRTESGKLTIVN